MNWYSISNATIIALSKEVIYNFERDDLLNHTAFSGHRTPRFALRAKTMCDSIRGESGLRKILILGWLIIKSLLGWVGLKLYTNLFALNPTQAAFYSGKFLHGAYWIYCNRSVKMCSDSYDLVWFEFLAPEISAANFLYCLKHRECLMWSYCWFIIEYQVSIFHTWINWVYFN